MKKTGVLIALLSISIHSSLLICQQDHLEVDGKVKVSKMDTVNSGDLIVVRETDGTLAVREVTTMNQLLSVHGDTLFISDGNFLVLNGLGCMDPNRTFKKRIECGESPCSMVAAGLPMDSVIGKFYQGGYLFYVDTISTDSCQGLVASPDDLGEAVFCHGACGDLPGVVNATLLPWYDAGFGDGKTNTTAIINQSPVGGAPNAAKLCEDLSVNAYDDWFLPDANKLARMMFVLVPKFPDLFPGYGGAYWSSSEDADGSSAYAGTVDLIDHFGVGGNPCNEFPKFGNYEVRAVRMFTTPY